MEASELKLEAENAKLKRMYAELALDNAAMKYLIAKSRAPERKCETVAPVEVPRGTGPPLDWTPSC